MDARTVFTDSNDVSGLDTDSLSPDQPSFIHLDLASLNLLSDSLESIFDSSPCFNYFADAKITVASGREIPVHRCILSARSAFFEKVFREKQRDLNLELKDLGGDLEIGFDSLVCVLGYLYSGKIKGLPKDVCVCVDDDCSHVACRPVVDFLAEVLYASFLFQIPELIDFWQRRHLLEIVDKAAADDVLVILSVAIICGKDCEELLAKCIEILVKSDIDFVTLDRALSEEIVKQITDSRLELSMEDLQIPNKHVKRIHRALDSDDVELVRMLLGEGHTSLDASCALHYAVAYADAKTTTELLDLALADVNHTNARGYTVLHVAAMRREPKIIVSLLTKGARPSDLTPDGRKALQIAKRRTKAVDYYKSTLGGKETPKDRLCIEILEQAERSAPLLGEASVSLAVAGDDLRSKLLYLENRVALARLLFPMEAKVAMDIAHVDGTSEFTFESMYSQNFANAQRTAVDLNDAPFVIKAEHLARFRALSKTVELGRRFFPRCTKVVDTFVDVESWQWNDDTPEERELKRQRCLEIQEVLSKAFSEDKEEFDRSNYISSSSSSTIL